MVDQNFCKCFKHKWILTKYKVSLDGENIKDINNVELLMRLNNVFKKGREKIRRELKEEIKKENL